MIARSTYYTGAAATFETQTERNHMFTIEKNIPLINPTYSRNKGDSKYPLSTMDIGDSFLIEGSKDEAKVYRNRLLSVINRVQKKSEARFATRAVDGGIRIWRTA